MKYRDFELTSWQRFFEEQCDGYFNYIYDESYTYNVYDTQESDYPRIIDWEYSYLRVFFVNK